MGTPSPTLCFLYNYSRRENNKLLLPPFWDIIPIYLLAAPALGLILCFLKELISTVVYYGE
jgi:hypothetical protein